MNRMKLVSAFIMYFVFFAFPAHSQGLVHRLFMRGTVVQLSGQEATICVGKEDGAVIGQTLQVRRIVGSPKALRLAEIGEVRITSVINDHFATATVLRGDVKKNDLVEIRKN